MLGNEVHQRNVTTNEIQLHILKAEKYNFHRG